MGALAKQPPEYSIKGAVLTLDLAHGEVAFFNGYEPREMIFNGLMERAGTIWSHYQAMLRGNTLVREGIELEMKTEVSPLCGFCDHIATCPRFETEDVPQLAGVVEALQQLQAREKKMQGEIKKLKNHLLAVVEQKGPIKSGGCFLRKATRSRKYLDMNRLEAFLAESGTVLEEYLENRSFSFLEIRKTKAQAA
jgi:CRISPR-associated exonuclease Cas4